MTTMNMTFSYAGSLLSSPPSFREPRTILEALDGNASLHPEKRTLREHPPGNVVEVSKSSSTENNNASTGTGSRLSSFRSTTGGLNRSVSEQEIHGEFFEKGGVSLSLDEVLKHDDQSSTVALFRSNENSAPGLESWLAKHAHDGVRKPRKPAMFKSRPCSFFFRDGLCPYGEKCFFLHHEDRMRLFEQEFLSRFRLTGKRLPIFEQVAPSIPGSKTYFCSAIEASYPGMLCMFF